MPQAPVPATETEERLRREVHAALDGFRAALHAYRKATRQPPVFLLEKRAPRLRDDAFAQAQLFSDRNAMLASLAIGDCGAEVGVQHGNFSRFLLDNLPVKKLHLFEMNPGAIRRDVRDSARVIVHGGDSATNLRRQPDASFDWIYVDGDHSYLGALRDARAALDKLRPGGLLFFNDYAHWSYGEAMPYGVMAVVNELVNEGHDVAAVALNYWGYFDIALRR